MGRLRILPEYILFKPALHALNNPVWLFQSFLYAHLHHQSTFHRTVIINDIRMYIHAE